MLNWKRNHLIILKVAKQKSTMIPEYYELCQVNLLLLHSAISADVPLSLTFCTCWATDTFNPHWAARGC